MKDLINFEPEVSKEHLQQIQEQAKNLPAVITSTKEFGLVYSAYQVVRKLIIALDKKEEGLFKAEKVKFEEVKKEISFEKWKFLDILAPLKVELGNKREDWETKKEKIKQDAAEEAAAEQKAEFERQELIRKHTQALEENWLIDENKRLDKEAKKLETDKLAFEIVQAEVEAYEENKRLDEQKEPEEEFNPEFDNQEGKNKNFLPQLDEQSMRFIESMDSGESYEDFAKKEFKQPTKTKTVVLEGTDHDFKIRSILQSTKDFRDYLNNELYEGFELKMQADLIGRFLNDVKSNISHIENYLPDTQEIE